MAFASKKGYINIANEKLTQLTPTSAQRKVKLDFRIITSDNIPLNKRENSSDLREIHSIESIKKGCLKNIFSLMPSKL